MIPLFKVFMSPDVIDYLEPVLHSGYIGEGPKVKAFETELGKFIDNPNVVATNSGTSAIVMALRLAGVKHGDYVLTTPMTCLATNMAILSLGAKPIWTDILLDGNMSIVSVPDATWSHVKAVVCVDWGGTPCELNKLWIKSKTYGIPLIEDACQSLGAIYQGQMIGNHADFVCFSFQAIKFLTTGDGGALVVRDGKLLEKARLMKWFGLDRTKTTHMRCEQNPPIWGYKFQMNDIAASIGLANIKYLSELLAITRKHARIYNEEFRGLYDVRVIEQGDWCLSTYWLYTILVRDPAHFTKYMHERGIEVSKAHTRNDNKKVFSQFWHGDRPGVHEFDTTHICIPVGWWLSDEDVRHVVQSVKEYSYDYDSLTSASSVRDTGERVALS